MRQHVHGHQGKVVRVKVCLEQGFQPTLPPVTASLDLPHIRTRLGVDWQRDRLGLQHLVDYDCSRSLQVVVHVFADS